MERSAIRGGSVRGKTCPGFAALLQATNYLLPRYRTRALTKIPLHHDRVQPAAEFQPDAGMRADHFEAGPGVHADRAGIGRIADDGDHLAEAPRLAFDDQPLQQERPDPAAVE